MMKKIKVALVAQDPRNGGGVTSVLDMVYKRLIAFGYDPMVISYAPYRFEPNMSVTLANGLRTLKLMRREKEIESLKSVLLGAYFPEIEINRYRENALWQDELKKYEMCMIVGGSAINGYAVCNHVQKYLAWVATTIYDDRIDSLKAKAGVFYPFEYFNLQVLQKMENKVLNGASAILLQSKYAEDSLARAGVDMKKSRIVPFAIDTSFFTPLRKEKTEKYLLMVGRFNDKRKNITLLINAYKKAKELVKKIPLLKLAGDKPSDEIVTYVQQLGLKNDIIFCGHTPLSKLPDLYRNATLFVLPSFQEGLGIVLLEAMASGVPVISTQCGGPDIIISHGENGLFCKNNDVDDMAQKIVTMLSDEALLQKFSETGRQTVEEHFSVEAVSKKLIGTFQDVYPEYFHSPILAEL